MGRPPKAAPVFLIISHPFPFPPFPLPLVPLRPSLAPPLLPLSASSPFPLSLPSLLFPSLLSPSGWVLLFSLFVP